MSFVSMGSTTNASTHYHMGQLQMGQTQNVKMMPHPSKEDVMLEGGREIYEAIKDIVRRAHMSITSNGESSWYKQETSNEFSVGDYGGSSSIRVLMQPQYVEGEPEKLQFSLQFNINRHLDGCDLTHACVKYLDINDPDDLNEESVYNLSHGFLKTNGVKTRVTGYGMEFETSVTGTEAMEGPMTTSGMGGSMAVQSHRRKGRR